MKAADRLPNYIRPRDHDLRSGKNVCQLCPKAWLVRHARNVYASLHDINDGVMSGGQRDNGDARNVGAGINLIIYYYYYCISPDI